MAIFGNNEVEQGYWDGNQYIFKKAQQPTYNVYDSAITPPSLLAPDIEPILNPMKYNYGRDGNSEDRTSKTKPSSGGVSMFGDTQLEQPEVTDYSKLAALPFVGGTIGAMDALNKGRANVQQEEALQGLLGVAPQGFFNDVVKAAFDAGSANRAVSALGLGRQDFGGRTTNMTGGHSITTGGVDRFGGPRAEMAAEAAEEAAAARKSAFQGVLDKAKSGGFSDRSGNGRASKSDSRRGGRDGSRTGMR